MPSDFNGDGRDDILWRNQNGGLSNWLATATGGFTVNDANGGAGAPLAWTVAGTGDFNGDLRDDLLWFNFTTGQISNWLSTTNGGWVINDGNALTSLPHDGWFVLGTGDFDLDGRDDILLGNEVDGSRTIWTATPSGGFVQTGAIYPLVAREYVFQDSVADFDGFGADVLWYDPASGNVGYCWNWGGELISIDLVTPNAGPGWWIVGTGDFNGDGFDDIMWRNDNGAHSNWLSDGDGNFVVNDANAFAMVPTAWRVVGIGDYNGDGRDDLLWRNDSSGALSNWLATANGGFLVNDAAAMTQVSLDWFVAPSVTGAGAWDY